MRNPSDPASLSSDTVTAISGYYTYKLAPIGQAPGMCACSVFFSSRRRHTRLQGDWSSDVCSSDLPPIERHHGQQVERIQQGEQMDLRAAGGAQVGQQRAGNVQYRRGVVTVIHEEIGRASCRERV